jgi:hypothetical protein
MPRRLEGRIPAFVVVGDAQYRRDVADAIVSALAAGKLAAGRCEYQPGSGQAPDRGGEPLQHVRSPDVEALLLDPAAEALVVTCSPSAIERYGFPLYFCDVIFAAKSPASHLAPLTARLVTNPLAADELSALVQDVAARYADPELGGPRPTVRWTGDPEEDASRGTSILRKIRCWRTRALPRVAFFAQVPGLQAAAGEKTGMILYDDIFEAIGRFAEHQLAMSGGASHRIAIPPVPEFVAWETPFVEITLSIPNAHREAGTRALEFAMREVNALLDRLE